MAASPALAWEACAVSSCTVVEKDSGACRSSWRFSGMRRQELSIWEKKEKRGFGERGRDEELPRHHHGGFREGETPRTEMVEEGTRCSPPPRCPREVGGVVAPPQCREFPRPSTIPTSPGQTSLPARLGYARHQNQAQGTDSRGNPSTATGKHQDFAMKKKLRIWENPVIPKLGVFWCSLPAKKIPFPAGKGSGLHPPKQIHFCAKPFHFHSGNSRQCWLKNVERETIQGLLLKIIIILGICPARAQEGAVELSLWMQPQG